MIKLALFDQINSTLLSSMKPDFTFHGFGATWYYKVLNSPPV